MLLFFHLCNSPWNDAEQTVVLFLSRKVKDLTYLIIVALIWYLGVSGNNSRSYVAWTFASPFAWASSNFLSSKLLLACVQVPLSNRQFRTYADWKSQCKSYDQQFRDACRSRRLIYEEEGKSLSTFNVVNSSRPSTGAKLLRLKWKKLNQLAAQVGGSRTIFCELFEEHKAKDTFWLDSSSTEKVGLLLTIVSVY